MKLRERITVILSIALIILFLYITITVIEQNFETNLIKDNLMWIIPIFLAITFFLLISSFIWSFKDLKNLFKKIDRKTWIALLLIFLVGLSLRVFVAPHTDRVLFDEDMYLQIGQNIVLYGKAGMCDYGDLEQCYIIWLNKQPNGYPFLMSFTFLFGTGETAAHYVTAIISSLTILTVFFISYLLFENKKISLFSSLIFSFIPIAIRWAPTTCSDTVFLFFMGLTVFAFLSYFKSKDNKVLLFSFVSLAYAIQVRPEGVLLIGVILILFLIFAKDLFYILSNKKLLAILIIFSILIIPHLLHLNAVKDEGWGTEQDKLSFEYVDNNFETNAGFFFENTRFPLIFTIFSLIGVAGMIISKKFKEEIFLGLWFIIFFTQYLLFYAGSFDYGTDVRFSLTMYIPVAIFAGFGAFFISKSAGDLVNRFFKNKYVHFAATIMIAIIIILAFIPFFNFVGEIGEKAWDARLHSDFLTDKSNELDDDSWILSLTPAIPQINGKKTFYTPNFRNTEWADKLLSEAEVYYFEGYWSRLSQFKTGIVQYMKDNYNLTEYDSITEKDRTYTLYHVTRK
jgi:hypothetical protein